MTSIKEIKALLFMPGDQPRYIAFEPTLDKIQTIVGGYTQTHRVPGERKRALAWMNDAGKVLGLEANTFATRRMYDLVKANEYIAGPLLVTGPLDNDKEPTDIPPELAKYMMDRCAMEASVDVPTTDQGEPSDSFSDEGA